MLKAANLPNLTAHTVHAFRPFAFRTVAHHCANARDGCRYHFIQAAISQMKYARHQPSQANIKHTHIYIAYAFRHVYRFRLSSL